MFLLTHDFDFGERVQLCHDEEDHQLWMVVSIQTSLDGHQTYSIAAGNLEYTADLGELEAALPEEHKPPYSTIVESLYDVGDQVYIVHDEDAHLCKIMCISVALDLSILYQVSCGADFTYWAVAPELSVTMPDIGSADISDCDSDQITSD